MNDKSTTTNPRGPLLSISTSEDNTQWLQLRQESLLSRLVTWSLVGILPPIRKQRSRGWQYVVSSGLQGLLYLAKCCPNQLAFHHLQFATGSLANPHMSGSYLPISAYFPPSDDFPSQRINENQDTIYRGSTLNHASSLTLSSFGVPDLTQLHKLYILLACMAFSGREHVQLQDNLIILLRRQLMHSSPLLKAIGIVGAIACLEVLCRRRRSSYTENLVFSERPSLLGNFSGNMVPSQTQFDAVTSQVLLFDSIERTRNVDRSSAIIRSDQNTSSISSNSCLSLRGPGTSLADNTAEVNLAEIDEDSETDIEEKSDSASELAFNDLRETRHSRKSGAQ
ncbi:unnamed protein product, partial [Protopolystoma xenopodis]